MSRSILHHAIPSFELTIQQMVSASESARPATVAAMQAAGKAAAEHTSSLIPKQTGEAARSVSASVRHLRDGSYLLRIGPGKGRMRVRKGGRLTDHDTYALFYTYFFEHGTGIAGHKKRIIPPLQRGVIRAGGVLYQPSGSGQRAQHPFVRGRKHFDSTGAERLIDEINRIISTAVNNTLR